MRNLLTNNMKLEQPNFSVFKSKERERNEGEKIIEVEDEENCLKIMGVSLNQYLRAADARGVSKRCFHCFSEKHGSTECSLRFCKFCEKDIKVAQHYSILCPKCPKDLKKYLEAREKAKFDRRTNNVRYADDYDNYQFESEELSE